MRRQLPLSISALLVLVLVSCASAQTKTLYHKKSDFNDIIVREDADGVRTLLFEEGGATQTSMKVAEPAQLMLSYSRAIMTPLGIVPEPRRILIVGLGGGAMPTFFRKTYPEMSIDVAELDPAVIDVAKRFFFFKEDDKMKAHAGDGRKFIETTANRYDIIFLDAYGPDSIPFSLATREFLQAVRAKLTDNGIVVGNVWSQRSNKLYYSMIATYRDLFPEMHIVRAIASENQIFIAVPRKLGLTKRQLIDKAADLQEKRMPHLDLAAIVKAGYLDPERLPADAKILVDADTPKD